ncbi:MAG TPA: hypothetical protein ENK26_13785 [Gammaproteobacteria bacterium]|nr:hypothetical protein [Gammaproteobacteria bacterium]
MQACKLRRRSVISYGITCPEFNDIAEWYIRPMAKKMSHIVALTTGIIVGVLSWVVITKLFGVAEPYDTPVGGYIAMFLPAALAFFIALTDGLIKSLLFLAGVYLATAFYPYFFGSGEQKVWAGFGAVMASAYLFYAFAGALGGWFVRVIYLRFLHKHTRRAAEKIVDKTVELSEHIPQRAHETYTYTQKASHAGVVNLLVALLFAAIGALAYEYPSPPLNPIDIPILQTVVEWLGVGFMLIGVYEFTVSMRLMADNGAWHIVIDDENLVYETPKSTGEKRFSCRLDEIERIDMFLPDPDDYRNDSIKEPFYKIVLKNGRTYPLFSGRNHIDERRCIDALRARGVQVVERY